MGGTETLPRGTEIVPGLVLRGTPELRAGDQSMEESGMDTPLGSWGFEVGASAATGWRGRASREEGGG